MQGLREAPARPWLRGRSFSCSQTGPASFPFVPLPDPTPVTGSLLSDCLSDYSLACLSLPVPAPQSSSLRSRSTKKAPILELHKENVVNVNVHRRIAMNLKSSSKGHNQVSPQGLSQHLNDFRHGWSQPPIISE